MSEVPSYTNLVKHYDRLAQRYDRRWRSYLRQTVERALDVLALSGTERILDVGCGTAEFERLAIGRFPTLRLVGIDVAPGMIRLAQRKLCHAPQVGFALATAERLPFSQEAFDVVLCANMLHHVPVAQRVLRECSRVLRPGGQLVVVDWCRDFWHCRLMDGWLRLVDRTYVTMYRVADVSHILEELGMTMHQACRFLVRPFYGMMCIHAHSPRPDT